MVIFCKIRPIVAGSRANARIAFLLLRGELPTPVHTEFGPVADRFIIQRSSFKNIMSTLPRKIGKYEIVDVAGRGAMGIVYLAHDPFINRQVAIKVCSTGDDYPDDDQDVAQSGFSSMKPSQRARWTTPTFCACTTPVRPTTVNPISSWNTSRAGRP
jgi:hypothetical protein